MKKSSLIIFTFASSLLLFTGCSKNQLTCTKNNDSNKDEIVATFEDDKLSVIEITLVKSFSSQEEAENQAKVYEDLNKDYEKNNSSIRYTYEVDGNELTVTSYMDISKREKELQEIEPDVDLSESEDSLTTKRTKEEVKNIFEKQGYVCK